MQGRTRDRLGGPPHLRRRREFLPVAARAGVRASTRMFPLVEANVALALLRAGGVEGAAILRP